METCEKCGNPNEMYWCEECQSSSEESLCDQCGATIELDESYHDYCDEAGTLEE